PVLTVRSCFLCHAWSPPEIYALSLHDALPILPLRLHVARRFRRAPCRGGTGGRGCRPRDRGRAARLRAMPGLQTRLPGVGDPRADRKSTRLNSSHVKISYAVFCLKKKKNTVRA